MLETFEYVAISKSISHNIPKSEYQEKLRKRWFMCILIVNDATVRV